MHILEVKHLGKVIEKKEILKDISFSAESGECLLIAGLNGSGKSMLLKTIKGLEKESSGEILIDGKRVKARDRMRKIALVFQDSSLEIVGESVREDIAFGLENQGMDKDEIEAKVEEYLGLFGLKSLEDMNPRVLSGGEKRKFAIDSVLAMGPEIKLNDEPLSSLDYPSTVLVIKTICQLKEMGKTVILVSHEAEKLLKHVERTVILKNGEIVSERKSMDSLDDLRKNSIYIPNLPFEELSWL